MRLLFSSRLPSLVAEASTWTGLIAFSIAFEIPDYFDQRIDSNILLQQNIHLAVETPPVFLILHPGGFLAKIRVKLKFCDSLVFL